MPERRTQAWRAPTRSLQAAGVSGARQAAGIRRSCREQSNFPAERKQKDRLAERHPIRTLPDFRHHMTSRFILCSLAAAFLAAGTACHIFTKTKAPKESPNVAIDVETGFKQRWIDKRAADLTAAGTAAAARAQAEKEFRETYGYLRAADPGKR